MTVLPTYIWTMYRCPRCPAVSERERGCVGAAGTPHHDFCEMEAVEVIPKADLHAALSPTEGASDE